MGKALSKSKVIAAVADAVGMTKKEAQAAIEALVSLAYKEAANGFTIPGLGKLVKVRRKARMGRKPHLRTIAPNGLARYCSGKETTVVRELQHSLPYLDQGVAVDKSDRGQGYGLRCARSFGSTSKAKAHRSSQDEGQDHE